MCACVCTCVGAMLSTWLGLPSGSAPACSLDLLSRRVPWKGSSTAGIFACFVDSRHVHVNTRHPQAQTSKRLAVVPSMQGKHPGSEARSHKRQSTPHDRTCSGKKLTPGRAFEMLPCRDSNTSGHPRGRPPSHPSTHVRHGHAFGQGGVRKGQHGTGDDGGHEAKAGHKQRAQSLQGTGTGVGGSARLLHVRMDTAGCGRQAARSCVDMYACTHT